MNNLVFGLLMCCFGVTFSLLHLDNLNKINNKLKKQIDKIKRRLEILEK